MMVFVYEAGFFVSVYRTYKPKGRTSNTPPILYTIASYSKTDILGSRVCAVYLHRYKESPATFRLSLSTGNLAHKSPTSGAAWLV